MLNPITDFFGDILSVTWDAFFYSKRINHWVKTLVYLMITQPITLLLLYIGFSCVTTDPVRGYICIALTAVWCIFTMSFVIYRHKRKWRKFWKKT